MRKIIKQILIIVTFFRCLFAQPCRWPSQLAVPTDTASKAESGFIAGARQHLYITTFKSADTLKWVKNDSVFYLEQAGLAALNKDDAFQTSNQYLNCSGMAIKKKVIWDSVAAGLYWAPEVVYNAVRKSQGVQSLLDVGPIVAINRWPVPIWVRGGVSAKSWNDSIISWHVRDLKLGEFESDYGIFSAIEAGSRQKKILGKPLYINIQAYGRSMSTAQKYYGMGSALYYSAFESGDSVFVYTADTLTSGTEAILKDGAIYVNIPQRVSRSTLAMAGVKTKNRSGLKPALYYSFSTFSLRYPSNAMLLDDKRLLTHWIELMLEAENKFFNYSGGLMLRWYNYDKAYGKSQSFSQTLTRYDSLVLKANIYDHFGYNPQMVHRLSKYFDNGIGLEYSFDISRDSKTYPKEFGTTLAHFNDNDRIGRIHNAAVSYIFGECWNAKLQGSYSNNSVVYLNKRMSSGNRDNMFYLLGTKIEYNANEMLSVREEITAEATITRYHYPYVNIENPPERSRRLMSELNVKWQLLLPLGFYLRWREIFSDIGYWSTIAYQQYERGATEDSSKSGKEYYAIRNKMRMHEVLVSASLDLKENTNLVSGILFNDIFDRSFKSETGNYDVVEFDEGYKIEPYMEVRGRYWRKLFLEARIKIELKVGQSRKETVGQLLSARIPDMMVYCHFKY